MIAHVVHDVLRRHRWMLLGLAVVSTMMLRVMIWLRPHAVAGLALVVTGMLGLHLITSGLSRREVWIRPLSNREFWLCNWSTAAVAMPVFWLCCGALANLLSVAFGRATHWEPIVLSTMYVAVFGAIAVPLIPKLELSMRRSPEASLNLRGHTPRITMDGLGLGLAANLAGALLIVMLPFTLGPRLPHHFEAFSMPWMVGLVVAVAAAGITCAWTPSGPAIADHAQRLRALAPPSAPDLGRVRRFDRLTGPIRVLLPLSAKAFAAALAMLVVGGVGDWLFAGSGTLREWLAGSGLLLLDPATDLGSSSMGRSGLGGALTVLCVISPWLGFRRLLHALPLSAGDRLLLCLAGPVVAVSAAWLALIAFHAAVTGGFPVTIKPALWFFVVSFGAAGQALVDRWNVVPQPQSPGSNRIGVAIGLGVATMAILTRAANALTPEQHQSAALISAGLLLLVVATWGYRGGAPYNRRALRNRARRA
jgi:hypothetical protein